MKTKKRMTVFAILFFNMITYLAFSQTSIINIDFNGLSPSQHSPFLLYKEAHHGIRNPERGFEVKAGVIDMFTEDFNPDPNSDHNYEQYLLSGSNFYENIIAGDPNKNIKPLHDYLEYNFCEDGISLVEIEEYVNFTANNLVNNTPMRNQDIMMANSVYQNLEGLGLKAHLVMNSSYQIFHSTPNNDIYDIANDTYNNPYNENTTGIHTTGLSFYLNEMSEHYGEISPFVANVHLGWIYTPHDRNMYRHSGKWQKSNHSNYTIYPVGREVSNFDALTGSSPIVQNPNLIKNEHGDYRESKQKFDWTIAHSEADAWNYESRLNKIRAHIVDNILDAFPHQKILLSSMYPWSNYLGVKAGLTTFNNSYESQFNDFYSGNDLEQYPYWNALLTDDDLKKQRVGYYDGFFGGDTYSHAWSIGNGETQQIHWHSNYHPNTIALGVDWKDNKMNVDSYLLRKYRENIWMHGELPTYETTYINDCNVVGGIGETSAVSFTAKYNSFHNWLQDNCTPSSPVQYNWDLAEAMSDGRLQDGFWSALKMRYFNFTSFNIGHSHFLDGRSPYELKNNQSTTIYSYYQNAPLNLSVIPNKESTSIINWKTSDSELYQKLIDFNMPISDGYFGYENDIIRSPYEYMRDHLGYRLELQTAKIKLVNEPNNKYVTASAIVINRGFAAPQNPRTFYFVLLDYYNNEIIQAIRTDYDWREWHPDHFATSIDNHEDPLGANISSSADGPDSIANSKVGGIPLGDYKDDWHHTPLQDPYTPYGYRFNTTDLFNLNDLPSGLYKIGIWAPDPSQNLMNNPKYNVKFANQLSYIHSNGVNVIASFYKDSNGLLSASNDNDADGIENDIDEHPNNPIDYNGGTSLESNNPCFGFDLNNYWELCGTSYAERTQRPTNYKDITKPKDFKVFPNPFSEEFTIEFEGKKENVNVKIYDMLSRLVFEGDYSDTTSITISDEKIESGTYNIIIHDGIKQESELLIRK